MKYSLRSLLRFSIRDLFWLVLVCAVGAGWFAERQYLIAYIRARQREIDAIPNKSYIRLRPWPY